MTARRIISAIAALFVFAVAVLVMPNPAQAAPGGACSLEEWGNPKSFTDCVKRLGDSATAQTGCVTAPTPGSPTDGLAGWFASEPDSAKRAGVQGYYSRYGVAGYGLDTYDLGCLGNLKHPDITFANTAASYEFKSAAGILGAANALREMAYNPGSLWSWADPFIKDSTAAIYRYVFSPLGGVTIIVIGLFLIWRARHGVMSQALQVTAWAIFAMVLVTAVAKWPVQAAHGFDTVSTKGLAVVHSVLGPAPVKIDGPCPLGADACIDSRTVATRSSDVVTEAVLYRTWLRAVLGSADSATAQKYGPALYDATSLNWGEAARANQNPTLRQQLIETKAQDFNKIAKQIQTEDPVAYEHLQGTYGSDRVGAGTIAFFSAGAFAAFDVAASGVIILGFGIFRLAIILLPLLGTVGLFLYASAGMRRVFHMVAAAIINIILFGAGSGLYLTAVTLVFGSSLPGPGQLVIVIVAGVVCFVFLRPFRQMTYTLTGRSRKSPGLTSRIFKARKDIRTANQEAEQATAEAAASNPDAPRPETITRTQRRRTVTAVVDAVVPSAREATSHPAYATATEAVAAGRQEAARPENTSKTAKTRSAGRAAVDVLTRAVTPPSAEETVVDDTPAPTPAPAPRRRPSPRPRPENRS